VWLTTTATCQSTREGCGRTPLRYVIEQYLMSSISTVSYTLPSLRHMRLCPQLAGYDGVQPGR
jgi:hypothetical protein